MTRGSRSNTESWPEVFELPPELRATWRCGVHGDAALRAQSIAQKGPVRGHDLWPKQQ